MRFMALSWDRRIVTGMLWYRMVSATVVATGHRGAAVTPGQKIFALGASGVQKFPLTHWLHFGLTNQSYQVHPKSTALSCLSKTYRSS